MMLSICNLTMYILIFFSFVTQCGFVTGYNKALLTYLPTVVRSLALTGLLVHLIPVFVLCIQSPVMPGSHYSDFSARNWRFLGEKSARNQHGSHYNDFSARNRR